MLAVMTPGSFEPGGRGIRKIQKVRLMHAAIRHLISASGRWDVAGDGVPICQEDLAGTLVSYSWIVVDALRKLGVRVDTAEAEDLTQAIARRNHRASAEGIEMTRALLELHAAALPRGFSAAAPALTRFDSAQSARGSIGSLTKMVGAGIRNQRIVEMAGRHSASFSIPVPAELERRWTASGVFPSIDPELVRIARTQAA